MLAKLLQVQARPQRYGKWSVPDLYPKAKEPDNPLDGMTFIASDPGDPSEELSGDG